jgi:hypothetical protein
MGFSSVNYNERATSTLEEAGCQNIKALILQTSIILEQKRKGLVVVSKHDEVAPKCLTEFAAISWCSPCSQRRCWERRYDGRLIDLYVLRGL